MNERTSVQKYSALLQNALIGFWMVVPSLFTAYIYTTHNQDTLFQNDGIYRAIVLITLVTILLAIALACYCYNKHPETTVRYILYGLVFIFITNTIRLLANHEVSSLFSFGSESRLIYATMLVIALHHWEDGPDDFQFVGYKSFLMPLPLIYLLLIVATILLQLVSSVSPGIIYKLATLLVMMVGLFQLYRMPRLNRPIYLCFGSVVMTAHAAFALLLGETWSHEWWLGQVFFLMALLILCQALISAILTTARLTVTETEEQVVKLQHMADEASRLTERANAAKVRFMAAASHDLRQPLVPIKLFAELLISELHGSPQDALVRKLRSSVQSLDELLNKMMEFSRLEAGMVHTKKEEVRLGDVLSRFHQEFEPVAKAKGLSLHMVDSSSVVITDRVLLELVLRNLIENAIRYTKQGGILIGCRLKDRHILLSVYDTGIGISYDQQSSIFTEYFQADIGRQEHRVGLGLGLATVERICKVLEIPISVRSIPGQGSWFYVALPRTKERRAQVQAIETLIMPDPGPLRVVVIDDEPNVREGIIAILVRMGWEPMAVNSIAEALESLDFDALPDAIVTDLRLNPEECGLDAITAIHQATGQNIPAVIITGDASHHRLGDAMDSPWPILVKPFSTLALYNAVTGIVLKYRNKIG